MTSQITSLEAFQDVQRTLGKRQLMVYETIRKLGEADNLTISKYLNLPINSTCPRVLELREMKLVGVSREGISKHTGRKVIYWKIVREIR